ncbi:hypothetical protein PUN28_003871 [Cardiocondyla obscurior]|uniref:Uncharacterized protein n=1 Tax=Cardiocondyla obscurior TaxID=286306 RepID=A0AAW2GP86_9HYME
MLGRSADLCKDVPSRRSRRESYVSEEQARREILYTRTHTYIHAHATIATAIIIVEWYFVPSPRRDVPTSAARGLLAKAERMRIIKKKE